MKKSKLIVSFALLLMNCLCAISSHAQEMKKITGTVTDVHNEAVIGASVAVAGTAQGTVTDMDGNFELSVPLGSIIKISYIGYAPYQEKVIATKTNYLIALQEDFQALDELVVVGYGTQKRSELTGSINSIRTSEIKDFSAKSLSEAIGGLAAGVMVTKSSGKPGEAADIIIRGAGSINGLKPLYIVDGVRQGTDFNFNMRDVESIEILKDAGSCAIYGAQAAGGVILVTTRHGSGEKTTVTANARYGLRNITTDIQLLDREGFIKAKSNTGIDILAFEGVDNATLLPNADWMDIMYETGIEQEYNVSISGSNEKTNAFLSAAYYSDKGVFLDTQTERLSFRTNVDYHLNKHVTIGETIYGSYRTTNPENPSSIYANVIPFRTVPTMNAQDPDNLGGWAATPSYLNGPNLYGNEMAYCSNDNGYTLNASAYIQVRFLKGLDLRITGAGDFYGFSRRTFIKPYNFRSMQGGQTMTSHAGTSQNLTFNAVLTYENTWGDHGLKVMLGTESLRYDAYNLEVPAGGFLVPFAESVNLGTVDGTNTRDHVGIGRTQSFFGRINYSYLGKYLLTANVRRDGSDKFGPNNRWGTFPSVNAAWRISEETFVKNNAGWLSNAKARISWGILGNDGIPQFLYEPAYRSSDILYDFGDGYVSGWAVFKIPNKDIKWEEVNQTDFGMDLGFLDNRLSFTYDYYNRQTKDMLYDRYVPLTSGGGVYGTYDTADRAAVMKVNAGLMENKGHEFSIAWTDKKGDLRYSIGANASFNSNKVKRIGEKDGTIANPINGLPIAGEAYTGSVNLTEDGQPLSQFYGYRCLGIFQSQEQIDEYNARAVEASGGKKKYYQNANTAPGDLIFDDSGQGWVDANSQTCIGNPWPKMIGGITMNFEYKGFDLGLVFQGAAGFEIYNAVKAYANNFVGDGNTTAEIFQNSFFGENGLTGMPRCGYLNDQGAWVSDAQLNRNFTTISSFWVEKGNYLKLKNLVFGYSLPKKISRKAWIENARLYLSAQNVFTLTRYSGIDPEIGGGGDGANNVLTRGIDNYNRYLPSRLISFGIDLTF
jgi:TonB-linked SusC/RagA family outer membrane protein